MSENPEANDERPCLHCLIGDLISEFYAEYGSLSGGMDTIRQWTTSKRAGSDNSDLPRPGRDAGGHRIQKGMPRPLSPAADMPPRKLRAMYQLRTLAAQHEVCKSIAGAALWGTQ
jgi:hypothetical protein